MENFAAMMNDKAKELGCENTHFVTPNGLDGEDAQGFHSTTAVDLARIMSYCIKESPKRMNFWRLHRRLPIHFRMRMETELTPAATIMRS